MPTAANQVTVIVTVRNEAQTITQLLQALAQQTVQPHLVIIADGGSSDATLKLLKESSLKPIVLTAPGNRSIGRNAAIKAAKTTLIAITDAGCIPASNWLEELLKTYQNSGAPVVAGYYFGLPRTPFEEAVVPYALVMPDRVDEFRFLPATRSMLLEKKVCEDVGGFDETLSDNEDYAFAHAIETAGFAIAFCKVARVGWMPRATTAGFWTMIYRFARGDVQAGLWRPKVGLIFVRYLVAVFLLLKIILSMQFVPSVLLVVAFAGLYGCWALYKNKRYVARGWYWLPVLQVLSDWAVMLGSIEGALLRLQKNKTRSVPVK